MTGLTVGADPEFFLLDYKKDGCMIDASTIFEGTKESPAQFRTKRNRTLSYHPDGLALEVGVPLMHTLKEFERTPMDILSDMFELLNSKDPDMQLDISYGYTLRLSRWPITINPTAKSVTTIGCDPDHDAYLGGSPRTATLKDLGDYRTAGGHIHIGFTGGVENMNCPSFVAALLCDLFIAAPVWRITNNHSEREGTKPLFYRQPGLYRDKPYGIEYRSLSFRWFNNVESRKKMWPMIEKVNQLVTRADPKSLRKFAEETNWALLRKSMQEMNANELSGIHEDALARADDIVLKKD